MKKIQGFIALLTILWITGCSTPDLSVSYVANPDLPPEDFQVMTEIEKQISRDYPIIVPNLAVGTNPGTVDLLQAFIAAGKKYNIPHEFLYSIAKCESNLRQFNSSGQPLVSGDGGIGIMQVTPWAVSQTFDEYQLKWNYQYNIEAGAQVLLGKWKYVSGRNPIGDKDPMKLENWYFAIWAYNGYSTINNPNEYRNGPRTWSNGQVTWTTDKPYQEKVYQALNTKFLVNVTRIPNSSLPLTGIPASGKAFPTPAPIHYSANNSSPATTTTTSTTTTSTTTTTTTTTVVSYEKPFYRTLSYQSPMINGSDVKLLQVLLNDWSSSKGKSQITADGYFGSQCKTKVTEFQSYYGLTADGIAGKATLEKLVGEFIKISSYRSPWYRLLYKTSPMLSGDDVKTLQSLYNIWASRNGKTAVAVDGYFGNDAYQAVLNFQNAEKALLGTPDGMAGNQTTRLLFVRTYF